MNTTIHDTCGAASIGPTEARRLRALDVVIGLIVPCRSSLGDRTRPGIISHMPFGGDSAVGSSTAQEIFERDYGVAEFVAKTVSRGGEVGDAAATAVRAVIAGTPIDASSASCRETLLATLLAALAAHDLLDEAACGDAPDAGALFPAEHRWAGWWGEDRYPHPWPAAVALDRARVLRALRRLPLRLRMHLVLKEVAGLDAGAIERLLGAGAASPAADLDDARLGYVAYLSDEISGTSQ